MDFICLPVICGCSTNISQHGDPTLRVCPRCNNVSVYSAKSKEYFDVCFVPLIPMKTKEVWHCNICQWEVYQQQGYEPARPGMYPPPQQGVWQQQPPPGPGMNWQGPPQNYQPGYQAPYPK